MSLPIKLISTDFDGTLHSEFEHPPVPLALQELIGQLQQQGALWAINTGRDLSSLMESLARAKLSIKPDYLVLVEREIHAHEPPRYVGLEEWNLACMQEHEKLFVQVRADLPRLQAWVAERFSATLYEDPYSPLCLIAKTNADADLIHAFLDEYCREVPHLTVVRNDIYARFSHAAYNKGSALREIARRHGIQTHETVVAGDHLNDLPMLCRSVGQWIVSPSNAIGVVKEQVRREMGYISNLSHGHGVADGLRHCLRTLGHPMGLA